MKVNMVVLAYNNKNLLKECLPSIVIAAEASRFKPTVTVLDNCSTDGSIAFLKEEFSNVEIYTATENKVYCSYNDFFKSSDDDIIVILNSDIKVDRFFLDPLIEHFKKEPDIFLVASKVYRFDGITYEGDNSRATQYFGVISANTQFKGYEKLIESSGFTFSSGNGAFDRKKLLLLGGFEELYLPGRYEDVDFCYRAWKAGFKAIYEPKSIMYHKGYASFKAVYNDAQIQSMVFRNSIFFMWKNLTDFTMLFKFCFWLLPRLCFFLLSARPYFIGAFFKALLKMPELIQKRRLVQKMFKLTDKQVLKVVGA